MWRAYGNSILYTVSTTVLVIITSVMGAYPLSVPELRGRKYVVAFVLLPMYFGGGLIPTFLLTTLLRRIAWRTYPIDMASPAPTAPNPAPYVGIRVTNPTNTVNTYAAAQIPYGLALFVA